MPRTIVHLDADAFFASVEQAADPRLRGKPIAVGGEQRGIIASASYEARRMGIYTPMPTVRARKLCPKLIVLPGDFDKYERFSRWMFSYAYDFTPDVEISSIDEGYFDLSGTRAAPAGIAETIRKAIRDALKITVSEGIAANKLVSQIASKLNKPAAFAQVPHGHEKSFLHPLPNRWLPGVGPKTAARLNAAGLAHIGQIAATPLDLLLLLLGNSARSMKEFAQGTDDRPLVPAGEPAKSYSQQETFAADTTDEDHLDALLHRMADHLMAKVREDGKSIRTVTVKVRYNDMAENQCGESLLEPTDLETDLYSRLRPLLRRAWERRVSLRMVSLKLSNIYEGLFRVELPLERSAEQVTARRRLAGVIDELRRTRGRQVILRGHDFQLRDPSDLRPARAPAPPRLARLPVRRASAGLYVPLNVRSHYSFLNSTLSIEAIVGLAKRHELPAVALADQGNLHGAVEFVLAARQASLKPILGVHLELEGHPLQLYAQTMQGYHNLCRLLSPRVAQAASLPYRRLPVGGASEGRDASELSNAAQIGHPRHGRLAACATGQPPFGEPPRGSSQVVASYHQLEGLTDGLLAVSGDRRLAELFPKRFYFAIASARDLKRYQKGEPAVIACPVHYARLEDRAKFDIVQSIRTLTLLRQEHPGKQLTGNFHFRAPREMRERLGNYPELLDATLELAERCAFDFPFGKPQFPAFRPPDGSTARAFLRRLVLEGLRQRYPKRSARLLSQVDEELAIIGLVGYEEYFLVVWDLLQLCRQHGIEWITRGSAADSLVCYCLRISDVCPLRFDLYFRRFLNQDRMQLNKLPDIDIDFPHDRKDDVIDLIFQRYGPEHVAVVGGFSTYQARGAVADVAKVLGVSEYQIRRFTEHFPHAHAHDIIEAIQQRQECRDLPVHEDPYRTALEMAAFLDGFPRYAKMHPCGVVLSRQPMHELTPTFLSSKGYPTTHFDMDAVEVIGLIKIDILAQGGLAAMRDVKQSLAIRGLAVDLQTFTICPTSVEEASLQLNDRTDLATFPAVAEPPRRERSAGCQPAVSPTASRPDARSLGESPPPHQRPFDLRAQAGWQPAKRQAGSLRYGHATLCEPQVHGEGGTAGELRPNQPPRDAPEADVSEKEGDPWIDPAVWEMIASGGARAVHHIESPAMISLCRMCNVRDIDGLIAIVSVIRPGAANEQKKVKFTRRYQGLEPVTYPHPSLAACLRSTFGLVVYEEHILQICEAFAGLAPGRADVLRRALGKEKQPVIDEIQKEFFASAQARGHDGEKIAEVWELVRGFAGYAFCKAHSTAYGVEAYQSAWLKKYFPAEFMAAVLTNGKGFYDPLVYVLECHRLGLSLRPPCVNHPGPQFGVEHTSIRVPVSYIKGLASRTVETIFREHTRAPFRSLQDFHQRVAPALEEMELLIRAGAFDVFGRTRTAQFWENQASHRAWGDQRTPGQGWLLPCPDAGVPPDLREPTRRERLECEAELFGFPASGHPLELHDHIAWDTYCPVARLGEHVGEEIVTCGLVIEQRLHHQVTGEPMKFLTLADWTGVVETELFAATYRSYGLATIRYPVLEVTARVEPFENGRGHSLRVLRAGKPRVRPAV